MEPILDKLFNIQIYVMERFFKLSPKFSCNFETTDKKDSRIVNMGAKQKVMWFRLEWLARGLW